MNYGRLLGAKGQMDKALAICAAVESVAGNDADTLFSLGQLYNEMKRPDKAKATMERFLLLKKDPQDSRIPKAQALVQQLASVTKPASSASSSPPTVSSPSQKRYYRRRHYYRSR